MDIELIRATEALARSAWLIPALFVLCALDGVVPVVPGETLVIAAGVFATTGGPDFATVVAAAALGSLAGDHLCYALGRRLGATRWLRGRPGTRRAAALHRADRLLRRRGGPVILTARFVPSGRTAVSLAAGTTGYPLRAFTMWAAPAATAWAVYATMLGQVGGQVAGRSPVHAILLGLGCGLVVTFVPWLVRRCRKKVAGPVNRDAVPIR
jgi:membrane protein DedA with SNARE-associated domain